MVKTTKNVAYPKT